ncbi:MAG: hypothetical protein K5765_05555 [Clostridia bacterium]|nr:hypothetical protein [Clostridia bacterium]
MKNKKHIIIPIIIFVLACVIGLIVSIIDFTVVNKTMSYSYETIQFDYDGASDGLDPDGNIFNPVDFLTDDVISSGLEKSGMSTTYETSLVKQYIVMENVVPEDVVDEITSYTSLVGDSSATRNITTSDYHPVRYRFVLYRDFNKKISKDQLNKLLSNIVDSYCERFYSVYQKSLDTSEYNEIYSMEKYDYIYQAQVFSSKISILSSYARGLYSIHSDFTVNGQTFNDISLKCSQLISSDISKINSTIILNALSKDIERLKNYYNYKIEVLNYDKAKYTSDLANINEQLNDYKKDSTVYVGSGENIVKVESNSSETYNYLLNKQITISNTIASINTEISDYQSILDDINNASGTDDEYQYVETNITKLSSNYDALEETFETMLNEYNKEYITTGTISKTGVQYYSSSILSFAFIVRCIEFCIPFALVTALGIGIYLLSREIKKKKN